MFFLYVFLTIVPDFWLVSICFNARPPFIFKSTGAYQPTRDHSGVQLAVLQRITDVTIGVSSSLQSRKRSAGAFQKTSSLVKQYSEDRDVFIGCSLVMSSLLDLDHR